jgi:hypothetical protein
VGERSRTVGGFGLPKHVLDDAIFRTGRRRSSGRLARSRYREPDDLREQPRRDLATLHALRVEHRLRRALAPSEAAPSEAACCDTRHGRDPGSRSARTRGSRRAGSGSRASPGGSDSDDGEPEPPLAAANDQAARAALARRGGIDSVPRSASRCGRREGRAVLDCVRAARPERTTSPPRREAG